MIPSSMGLYSSGIPTAGSVDSDMVIALGDYDDDDDGGKGKRRWILITDCYIWFCLLNNLAMSAIRTKLVFGSLIVVT